MKKEPKDTIHYTQYSNTSAVPTTGEVISEVPVTLNVNGADWITFMCTPTDLEELAVGFLYNEGIIETFDDLASIYICADDSLIEVWLHRGHEQPTKWRRTSGCAGGATSVTDDDNMLFHKNKVCEGIESSLSTAQIYKLVDQLFDSQDLYHTTGGVHTSALCDGETVCFVAEDIGRHNTLDKLAGKMVQQKPLEKLEVIITTGRISSDMLQKALRIGCTYVISRTSPSSRSIHMAERAGITLIGYARRTGFRVYTNANRIKASAPIDENILG